MTRRLIKEPLIAIVGATGTGKSELAVALAKRYNGEVINGDAMQLYAGLPVITNKITVEEEQGIPHHLLGCIDLHEQTWVVRTFVQRALEAIKAIRERGRLPILVGGTHYYTQSLLFNETLSDDEEISVGDQDEQYDLPALQLPTPQLFEELQRVDPVMAQRWHPHDRRKIQRSLEIYLKTGERASDVYARRRARHDINGESQDSDQLHDASTGSLARFNALIFWTHAQQDVLRSRLDQRVDKMVSAGLLEEVQTLESVAAEAAAQQRPVDETRGIWVSIGYKEFKPYMEALKDAHSNNDAIEKAKAASIERTKIATRQYAKRQTRWIRIKLLHALRTAALSDKLFLLDTSDLSQYHEHVTQVAADLTGRFLDAQDLPLPETLSAVAKSELVPLRDYDMSAAPEKWTKQHCEVCNVTCVMEQQWMQHVKSRSHRRAMSKRKEENASSAAG